MSELYDVDVLAWSERQGDLLRRIAKGERLSAAVDWPNVIEEIEAMGRSELRACGSYLQQAMFHLLKLHAWPDSRAAPHWLAETGTFLADADRCATAFMQGKIDLEAEYRRATRQARFAAEETEAPPRSWPLTCPFSLEELLLGDLPALVAALARP